MYTRAIFKLSASSTRNCNLQNTLKQNGTISNNHIKDKGLFKSLHSTQGPVIYIFSFGNRGMFTLASAT